MSFRIRTPSLFRPRKSVDRAVLKESRALVEDFNRLALLVPRSLVAMITGGPVLDDRLVGAAEAMSGAQPAGETQEKIAIAAPSSEPDPGFTIDVRRK
jgi:hypothetical protein